VYGAPLADLIQGNDALVSAFNPGWKDPNLHKDEVRGTIPIIAAVCSKAAWRAHSAGQLQKSFSLLQGLYNLSFEPHVKDMSECGAAASPPKERGAE